jgi:hypothetical protein
MGQRVSTQKLGAQAGVQEMGNVVDSAAAPELALKTPTTTGQIVKRLVEDPDLFWQHRALTTNLADQALMNATSSEIGRRLVLANNCISGVPTVLGGSRFSHVFELDLSHNDLCGELDLSMMLHLGKLYLSHNPQLKEAPRVSGALRVLHMNHTGMMSGNGISESIRSMTHLEVLHVKGNGLTFLPNWWGEMTSLTELDVSNNALWRLPMSIGDIPKLESFCSRSNPLPAPLRRLVLSGPLINDWVHSTLVVYDVFVTLFLTWQRLRHLSDAELQLIPRPHFGDMPRDLLGVIASFMAAAIRGPRKSARSNCNGKKERKKLV